MRLDRNFSLFAFRTLRPALRRSAVAVFIAITLTAGFVLVRGRAATIGFSWPESFTKIFAIRSARTLSPFVACSSNGTGGGNWSAGATWSGCSGAGGVPAAGDDVTINSGDTVTIETTPITVNSLTVNGVLQYDATSGRALTVMNSVTVGGALKASAAFATGSTTQTLTIGGSLANNGTFTARQTGTTNGIRVINVTMNGSSAVTLSGSAASIDFNLLTVNLGSSATSITPSINVNFVNSSGTAFTFTQGKWVQNSNTTTIPANALTVTSTSELSVGGGTFTVTSAGLTINGKLTLTSGTVNVGNAVANSFTLSGATANAQISGGTLNIAGRWDQAVSATANITGGSVSVSTAGQTSSATATFSVNSTSTFTMGSGNGAIKINNANSGAGGDLKVLTSTALAAGTFTIGNGAGTAGNILIQATPSLNSVTIDAGSTTPALSSNLSVNGNLTITTGSFDLSSFTANRASSGGTLTLANGTTLRIGGTNTLPANYSAHSIGSTSTINYSGTTQSVATLNSSQSYGNLTISGSGTKTLSGNIVVASTLTLSAGTLAVSNKILELDGDTSVSSGALDASSGTVDYFQSSSGQHIIAADYFILAFNNQNKILPGAIIGILDTFTPSSATGHTITGSTFDFKKTSGSETIPAFNYFNLTSSGGTNSRTLASSGVIGIANVFTPGGDAYTVTGSTIEYNGTSAQTMPSSRGFNYNNLTINNPAGVTAPDLSGQTASIASTLSLKSGSFTLNTGNGVTLANGATIDRSNGSISAAPAFGTSVNVRYTGTSNTTTGPEIPTSTSVLNNLTINDAAGVTLGTNAQVNGTLTFSVDNGLLTTSTNTLTLGSSGVTSGAGSLRYVVGNLKKLSLTSSFTFDVGHNGYSPLALSAVVGSGDFTVKAVNDFRISGTAQALKRYWTLTSGGGITSATLTFQWLSGDVHGTEATYIAFKIDGATITHPASTVNTLSHTGTVVAATSFSDWTFAEPLAPTAVKLTDFNAAQNGDDVFIQWETGYEVHNLGYNLYREVNGLRAKINRSIIAGSALISQRDTTMTAGFAYNWIHAGAGDKNATYWLEDVDLDGTSTFHGPFVAVKSQGQSAKGIERSPMLEKVGSQESGAGSQGIFVNGWPAAEKQRSEVRGQRSSAKTEGAVASQPSSVTNQALATQQSIAATRGVKIAVSKTGWYRINQQDLISSGLDSSANPAQLQLFANGQEVPIRVSGNGQQFTAADYVEFYGSGVDSPTDKAQSYYLISGQAAGARISSPAQPAGGSSVSGSPTFDFTIERKERTIYFSGLLNGDAENFFGEVIGTTALSEVMPVTHIGPTTGNARLEVTLQGVTTGAHIVRVIFNGSDLGTMTFAGTQHPSETFSVPVSAVVEGNNTLQLKAVNGGDTSLFDSMRLTYARAYAADANAAAISVSDAGITRVSGFTDSNIRVIDVTDANNIQELTPVVTTQAGGTYSVDVQIAGASTSQPHALYLFGNSAVASPDALKPNHPSTWKANENKADYVIVTSRDLMPSLAPLVAARQSQGMIVDVIDVEDLFDEFSFGLHSPTAVRDFMQTAIGTWKRGPHYVLLVGDASYDPKNYFGRGFNDVVPTKLIDTVQMEAASDDWFVDFNDDGVADASIGRLPVRTTSDAALMVNKIINYEKAPPDPSGGILLVADRTFESSSTALQAVVPGRIPVQRINRSSGDDSTIHDQILAAINSGPRMANYFGHGANGVWTSARLLANRDAPSLTNSRLSVFTMMTCLNGYFEDAFNESLSETLLKSQGGAVASWASTTLTEPEGQTLIAQEFYRQIFSPTAPTIGDAVRMAKLSTDDPDVRRTWTLFGDPAMSMFGQVAPSESKSTISGTITDSHGQPLAGVTVSLSGKQSRETITDANGTYSFADADTNSFYNVTPARANYSFNPGGRSFTLNGIHTSESFVGTANGGTLNPLDTDTFFVRQHYLDFLNREPDESGFNFWTNQIGSCGVDDRCREVKRVNTSAAYFLSIEFQETGFEVYRMYQAAYGNLPNSPVPLRLVEFTADAHDVSSGVIVGRANWQATLEANKAAFAQQFVQRARFAAQYPNSLSPAEFVDALFAQAGVAPAADERTEAISEFAGAADSLDIPARARALRRVAENPRLTRQEFNRAFVLMQYFGYLRRDPNSGPDADFSGYNFWLGKLNAFNGNFIDAEMVKAFLSSDEYRGRFTR